MIWSSPEEDSSRNHDLEEHTQIKQILKTKEPLKKTNQTKTIVYGASQMKITSLDLSYVFLYTYTQNALAFCFVHIYCTTTYAFYRKDAVEKHKTVNTRFRICWQLYLILTVSCFYKAVEIGKKKKKNSKKPPSAV